MDLAGHSRRADLVGCALQEIVADPPAKIERFLQLCRRSPNLAPGSLTCKTLAGALVPCRAAGGLLAGPGEPSLLLRLFPKQESQSKFLVLNERIQTLHREILERQRVQAKLHAEREWLQTTLASIGDAVIATDDAGNIAFMNSVAEALTGWSQTEAAGLPLDTVFRIINEHSRAPVENPVFAVLRDKRIVGLANHTILIARDGSERPIADSGAPIRDVNGAVIGVVLVFRDVTDSYRSQRLVIESERRFRRIFDSAHVAIWEQDFSEVNKRLLTLQHQGIVDLRSYFSAHPEFLQDAVKQVRILDVNPAAVNLLEAATKAELMESLPSIFAPDTYSVFAEELVAIAAGEATFQSETALVTLRGKHLQVLFTMSFPPDDPALSNVLVSLMDISDRKQAEEALRRANRSLQRSNDDLEHFAYAAAHDLQEPLRNVVLYTQVLERRYGHALDEAGREACQISIQGAKRMQSLVHGLLEYTRVISEAAPEANTTVPAVDCAEILSAVQQNLKASIDEARAQILYDGLPPVHAGVTHAIQLFQNLVGNAIKYRKPGQAAFVRITATEEAGEWIFRVSDNGIGIRPEYQRKIFEAFKRLHGSDIPGVGMGLTICNRIVAHYGGRMWVESNEGQGSTFAFTLPAGAHI